MTKPRKLGELVSTGSIYADGTLLAVDISGLTASAAELNIMDGVTVSTAEINCIAGATAPIQTQLDAFLSDTLSGPAPGIIYATVPITFTITNYDILKTYTLTTTNGTITRSGATITYTPSTLGAGGFVVNGRSVSGYTVEALAIGQQAYTTPGTYSWVAPANVVSVSAVVVGPGGQVSTSGDISTTTNTTYASYFISLSTVVGYPGLNNTTAQQAQGGSFLGDGGGSGGGSGNYSAVGGGGTGGGGVGLLGLGSNGVGGGAATGGATAGLSGSGGGGGGGGGPARNGTSGGGAGGYLGNGGQGGNGSASTGSGGGGGGGGSGGTNGGNVGSGTAGNYGGGQGGFVNGYCGGGLGWKNNIAVTVGTSYTVKVSGNGAVRIIWPGSTRSFPSTDTGDL